MSPQELQVQQKREVEKREETTAPARIYLPSTDIFETAEALTLVMEMPGVEKENVDVNVEDSVLRVDGRIDFSKYDGLQPIYTEYNVGHYRRRFTLPSRIDREKIRTEMKDGVLKVVLPKPEDAQAVPHQSELTALSQHHCGHAPIRIGPGGNRRRPGGEKSPLHADLAP